MEQGISYQLKESCLLVDAKHFETDRRIPEEIPSAHILDQRTKPYTYLKLSDGAGFIARFIVLGVDVALIPEILRSEYGLTSQDKEEGVDFENDVGQVVKMLDNYIETRSFVMPYDRPGPVAREKSAISFRLWRPFFWHSGKTATATNTKSKNLHENYQPRGHESVTEPANCFRIKTLALEIAEEFYPRPEIGFETVCSAARGGPYLTWGICCA
jgi:hypothetical protein